MRNAPISNSEFGIYSDAHLSASHHTIRCYVNVDCGITFMLLPKFNCSSSNVGKRVRDPFE